MATKNKNGFSLKKLIHNDKSLMIISLFLAVVIWITSSISIGDETDKTIKVTVPVKVSSALSEKLGGKFYSLLDNVDVEVTVKGAKYIVGQVTQDDLNITIDGSSVNKIGEQSVPIKVKNKSKRLDFTVEKVSPSELDVYYDINSTKTFDVDVDTSSISVADGYEQGDTVIDNNQVVVEGPKTFIDNINNVYVDFSVDSTKPLTESVTGNYKLSFGGTGTIDTDYITIKSKESKEEIDSVSVSVPILKKVTLPVAVDFENQPDSLPDNAITTTYSVKQINAGIIDNANLNSAVITTVDFNNIGIDGYSENVKLDKVEGFTVLDNIDSIKVNIKVSSDYAEQKITVPVSNVTVSGVSTGKKATVQKLSTSRITVVAPKDADITADDIKIKCDVSDLNDKNSYPCQITISGHKDSWVYGTYTATITVK